MTDPDKLRQLAKAFDEEGFKIEASMMLKRADLRAWSPEKKKQYRDIYEKAMLSHDAEKILKLATAFEQVTATGSAKKLRERAAFLQKAESGFDVPKIIVKPEVVKASNEKTIPSPPPSEPITKVEVPVPHVVVEEKTEIVPSTESVKPEDDSDQEEDLSDAAVIDGGHPLVDDSPKESSPAIHGDK